MYVSVSTNFIIDYNRFRLYRYHHTDYSKGVIYNYVARMLEGTAKICSPDRDIEIIPGDVFFIPMGLTYHSYWKGERIVWDSLGVTHLPGEQMYPLQKISTCSEMDELFEKMYENDTAETASIGLSYSLVELVLHGMEREKIPVNNLVERATRCMRESPTASIPEIAKRCHVSESGLYAAFRAIGTTPVTVRLEAQIKQAVSLLATTDLTVETIAEYCGFGSVVYFYRMLKRFTGKTSRDFRYRKLM